jgi:hypothetical protein
MDQEYKRLQGAYKRAVATNSDVGLILADINIIERNRLMFGGSVEGAASFIEYARFKGNASVLRMSYEDIYAAVVGDEAVRGVGAAVVGAFMPRAPAARQSLQRNTARIASAYNNSILSSETGAAGPRVVNQSKAARTNGEGPGSFVPKNESMSPEAAAYQDAVANGQPGQAYRVPYENPNPRGRPHVDFDGVQGPFAVDSKLSVVTRPKTVSQAVRQAQSLRQNGARGIWKVPNVAEAARARAMIQQAQAGDVLSVVVQK